MACDWWLPSIDTTKSTLKKNAISKWKKWFNVWLKLRFIRLSSKLVARMFLTVSTIPKNNILSRELIFSSYPTLISENGLIFVSAKRTARCILTFYRRVFVAARRIIFLSHLSDYYVASAISTKRREQRSSNTPVHPFNKARAYTHIRVHRYDGRPAYRQQPTPTKRAHANFGQDERASGIEQARRASAHRVDASRRGRRKGVTWAKVARIRVRGPWPLV